MATELCNDVRKLIIDRMETAEDMYLAVIHEMAPRRVMFYVSRNMRDPEHHVYFTYYKNDQEVTYLLRNPTMLRMMVEHALYKYDMNVASIYVQGEKKPPEPELNWRVPYGEDRTELHDYIQTHMLEFHYINHETEDTEKPTWVYPKYMEQILRRITVLVSTA
jgi:hypothetical protein